MSETCERASCDALVAPDARFCTLHQREVMIGLDECKAEGCDERVPFGSLWCGEHGTARAAGDLDASGRRLDVPVEGAPCRVPRCPHPALAKTIGKRPQGGWNDLCQEHYDEKRATHAGTLAVARSAKAGKQLAPPVAAPRARAVPPPMPEPERRAMYLLEHGWTERQNDQGDAIWFCSTELQPAEGRSVDEAYDWQVGVEAGRHGYALPPPENGNNPTPEIRADDGPTGDDPACPYWCALDQPHDGECRDFAGRTEKERIDGAITELVVPHRRPPLPEIGSAIERLPPIIPVPHFPEAAVMLDTTLESTESLEERILSAWVDALGDAYSALGAELLAPNGDGYTADKLNERIEALLKQAPGLRIACELLSEAVPSAGE